MKIILKIIIIAILIGSYFLIAQDKESIQGKNKLENSMEFKKQLPDSEWKKKLSPEQYRVLRQKGTEAPFSGEYNEFDKNGLYSCAACGSELFRSDAKFASSCGWPSFFEPVSAGSIIERQDLSHNMIRTEIVCGSCGSHLGHVFNDGPRPTGLRYCINSVSLKFEPGK